MEEILASIRRIIADDQDPAKRDSPAPAAPAPLPPPEDDVLDLADLEPPRPAPAPPVQLDDEVSFRDPEPSPHIDFDAIAIDDEPEDLHEEPEPEIEEPEPVFVAEPPRAREPSPPPQMPAPEPLITGNTDASVSHAFNMLAHTVLTNNARTLEDLVRDMLRPMLKVWLDDNLPALVERMVRAEIERVARGGR